MSSPHTPVNNRLNVQVSLSTMLLAIAVASFCLASLMYASRVPMIRREWSLMTGTSWDGPAVDSYEGRTAHLNFLLFTLMSPLLLAGGLSTMLGLARRWKMGRR